VSFGRRAARCPPRGREANDAWLGQTADSPCPARAETLELVRTVVRKEIREWGAGNVALSVVDFSSGRHPREGGDP